MYDFGSIAFFINVLLAPQLALAVFVAAVRLPLCFSYREPNQQARRERGHVSHVNRPRQSQPISNHSGQKRTHGVAVRSRVISEQPRTRERMEWDQHE